MTVSVAGQQQRELGRLVMRVIYDDFKLKQLFHLLICIKYFSDGIQS